VELITVDRIEENGIQSDVIMMHREGKDNKYILYSGAISLIRFSNDGMIYLH
jgi:hypothetical protein